MNGSKRIVPLWDLRACLLATLAGGDTCEDAFSGAKGWNGDKRYAEANTRMRMSYEVVAVSVE
jgi:hypothetical protein